jgi:hypothetical protein
VEDAIAHGSPVGVGNAAMILHGTHSDESGKSVDGGNIKLPFGYELELPPCLKKTGPKVWKFYRRAIWITRVLCLYENYDCTKEVEERCACVVDYQKREFDCEAIGYMECTDKFWKCVLPGL